MQKKRNKGFFFLCILIIGCFTLGCGDAQSEIREEQETLQPSPTNTPTPSSTPTPTNTPTPSPTNTPTPSPTPTPIPTAPPIGKIEIWCDYVGDNSYTDMEVKVSGIEGICDEVPRVAGTIKMRGNTSKLMRKKSYNIKFQEKTSIFGMEEGKKWNLLATAYERTMLRTPLGFTYAQMLGLEYTSQFYVTELWLNDVYKGVYIAIEPVQEGKKRVDLDLSEGDFLLECNIMRDDEGITYIETAEGMRFEVNEPEELTADQIETIVDRMNEAEAAMVTRDHTIYEQYIDVDSFVNYYIFEEFTKNVDFARLSTRYYYKDGKLYAGPAWDMDLTMGNVSTTHWETIYKQYNNASGYGDGSADSTHGFWANDKNWYRWLCQDEYFMDLVIKRWKEMLPYTINLATANELGPSRIDYFMEEYGPAFENNCLSKEEGGAGWVLYEQFTLMEYEKVLETHGEHVDLLRDWLVARVAWLDAAFDALE